MKRLLLIGMMALLAAVRADAGSIMGTTSVSMCNAASLADSGGTFKIDTGGAFKFTCSGP